MVLGYVPFCSKISHLASVIVDKSFEDRRLVSRDIYQMTPYEDVDHKFKSGGIHG